MTNNVHLADVCSKLYNELRGTGKSGEALSMLLKQAEDYQRVEDRLKGLTGFKFYYDKHICEAAYKDVLEVYKK